MKIKSICFDLDNVICKTINKNYKKSKPNYSAIKIINLLYKKNYFIKIYTARGMGKFNGNIKLVKKNYSHLTKMHLKKWKVKYHELIFGKTSYDLIVDDKALGFKKNWINLIKKKIKLSE